jgi:hypothetical protein
METHYVFENHDLVDTKNPGVSRDHARFGKGLIQKRAIFSATPFSCFSVLL